MNQISTHRFVNLLKGIQADSDRQFCFVLGAKEQNPLSSPANLPRCPNGMHNCPTDWYKGVTDCPKRSTDCYKHSTDNYFLTTN